MDIRGFCLCWKWQVAFSLLLCSWGWVSGQLRYAIVEESDPGTWIGNVAQDLGIKHAEISQRRLHLSSKKYEKYFAVNKENGVLTVNVRINRETICGSTVNCVLHLEVVAENPLELFSIDIEIQDINDNNPTFLANDYFIEITELVTSAGAQFALEIAKDLDIGINGVKQYILNTNSYFSLSVKNRVDGTLIPQLILEKVLDREEKQEHHLILTAIDGGEPPRSGSCNITITVVDINDNPPIFDQSVYRIKMKENVPLNTVVLLLNATDLDGGANGEINYYFDSHTSETSKQLFDLNQHSGEIFIKGNIDYEETYLHELSIKAEDKGLPRLIGNCLVQVEVEDVNDNSPEISFTSLTNEIQENIPLGTTVGLIDIRDKDSGKNCEIQLDMSPQLPFKIRTGKNRYSLVTDGILDREKISNYTIELIATDLGYPALSSKTTVILRISDVNDNSPTFTQSIYNAFIKENSDPGTFLCTVSANDPDEGVNSDLVYSIVETQIDGSSVTSFVYINSNNGNIYAQRSFDYEHIQTLQITVQVEDSGYPKLSSAIPIFIFILDTNDNSPILLYPEHSEDLIVQEKIPKSSSAGYLVTKLTAVDLDSGHNAWLAFNLIDPSSFLLFQVSKHTGEVRTVRGSQESENTDMQLIISISDHGDSPLSTTVTVLVSIVDDVVVERPKLGDFLRNSKPPSDITLYLIVSLVAISLVSLVTFIILLVKCLRKENYDYSNSCCYPSGSESKAYIDQYQPALFLNTDGTLKYMEVRMVPPGGQGQCYQTNVPPASQQRDSAFLQSLDFPQLKDFVKDNESASVASCLNDPIKLCHTCFKKQAYLQYIPSVVGGAQAFWGWGSGQLRYSIVEESDPGTWVGKLAQDLGIKRAEISQRKLHLSSEKYQKYFTVNKESGGLTINDRIDREILCGSIVKCVLRLEVVAENHLELFNIEIEIQDINDNYPTFSNDDYFIEITELLTSLGSQFALEIAEDLDIGSNSVNQYTLNTNPYFSLSVKNRKDGTFIPQLILEKVLDREEKQEHDLILTAIDGGEPAKSGSCHIKIIVLDINDNPPVFNQAVYKISLKENLPSNSFILILNATDQDEAMNGEIEYYFDGHTSASARKLFDLKQQGGELFITGNLDFEEVNFYELSVKAVDKGSPKLTGNCVVQVEIEDVNDNSPEIYFSSFTNEISENTPIGTIVGLINVEDKDSGKNGEIQLDITKNIPFKITVNKNHYSLISNGNLDREKISHYTIELIASDLGSPSLSSKTAVILRISDFNDNAPTFTQSTYNAFIKENSDPGTLLCSVSASDADEGVNSDLVYSIVESQIDGSSVSSFVYINSNNGDIYAQRSFDYEHIQTLQITIKAEDSGSPKLFSTVPVFIFIMDTNDNSPTLLYPEHSEDLIVQERIPKSTSAGYLVTKLTAVDLDSGHNAWLAFNLIDPHSSSQFQVSKHTGEIRTVQGSQETDNIEQHLIISISDHGDSSLSTTVTVVISIADDVVVQRTKSGDLLKNSKPPSDMTLYLIVSLVAISLVSLVTFIILLVKCLRKESYGNSNSCCYFSGSESKSYMDQYQPALFMNTDGTLKYMEVRMVTPGGQGQCYQTNLPPASQQRDSTFLQFLDFPQLRELVKDSDSTSDTSHLNDPSKGYCFITSVWDWASGQIYYSVAEESDTGTVIGNVARDLGFDQTTISKRKLHVGSEGSSRYFSIDHKYEALIVQERIDRESLCGYALSCVMHLELVSENPLELFSLEIQILDINDNAPIFLVANQVIKIIEQGSSPGTQIPLEKAQDPDLGVNSVAQYRLNKNTYFSLSVIQHKDGNLIPKLVIEKILDREEKKEHILTLTAIDGGEHPQSGTSQITVTIFDINDNAPVFDQSIYVIGIIENLPLKTPIIQLNATDLDEGINGEIEYSFHPNSQEATKKIFGLNTQTGEIFNNGIVDFEVANVYALSVRAIDKGIPELEGHCVVQIEVVDVNDNAPEIKFTSKVNEVPENAPVGTIIGFITVRDKDSGKNGEVKLKISPNLPFKCQPVSNRYTLVTSEHLDREKVSQYTIIVTASDLGSPSLSSQASIVINISDVNDNPPVFLQSAYNAFISENNEPGRPLCTISAGDPDEGDNAKLIYSIAESHIDSSPVSSFVYINSETGNIYAQRSFDYEQFQVLQITARVEDSGSPRLFSNVSVFIYIQDANDNYPSILYPENSMEVIAQETIPRSASPGYLVSKVSAVDLDSGHNAWLTYSLVQSGSPALFHISEYTGEVRTLQGFQEADNTEHRLVISVSDHGNPSLSSTVTLIVIIMENIVQESPKSHEFFTTSKSTSNMTLYLIVSLIAISLVSMITFVILIVRCLRNDQYNSNCGFCFSRNSYSHNYADQYKPTLYLNTDGTLKYMEVRMAPPETQGSCYPACFPSTGTHDLSFPRNGNCINHNDLLNETQSPSESKCVTTLNQPQQEIIGSACKRRNPSFPQVQLYQGTHWKFSPVILFWKQLKIWGWVSGQLRYSVAEESDLGTVVGNVAQDLGLNLADLNKRRLSLGSEESSKYFIIDQKHGTLIIQERNDRESLCGSSSSCLLHLEVVAENPLELFSLEIEILDINDNYPIFPVTDPEIKIIELLASPGVRFPLPSAKDLDVGKNGVRHYSLNQNPYFSLSEKYRSDGTLIAELVLEKNLDREEKSEHNLILSAIDGGEPPRSGSTQINIIVLDFNDNAPVFDQAIYKIGLLENLPLKTLVMKLNVTDLDEGANSEILYSFDDHTLDSAKDIFELNEITGEIFLKGHVDYESADLYELFVKAVDKGSPRREGRCVVKIEVQDVNDNIPEIVFTSKNNKVLENAPLGTVVGFITIRDRDSDKNGEVKLQISPNLPFKCQPISNRFTLVTSGYLDREKVSQYSITLVASDLGSPSLSSQAIIIINVSDVNDNAPTFLQSAYNAFISENNEPGRLLCTISAGDPDEGDNAKLSYFIAESHIDGSPVSSFAYINSETGNVYAQRSFDYEQLQVLQITVRAEDAGSPKLFSNVSVFIFIQDTNDNYPSILYPESSGEVIAQETIPRSASPGYLVSKVSAVDLDSGHNAWLTYSLDQSGSPVLFHISEYTGEVRTLRELQETDNTEHRLVISVSDHGKPSLSSTITVIVNFMENIPQENLKSHDFFTKTKTAPNMTLYLIISLVAISLVSLVTFIILLVRCLRKNYDSSCGSCFPNKSLPVSYMDQYKPALYLNTDGTLKYMEVRMAPPEPPGSCYPPCFPVTTNIPDSKYQCNLQIAETKSTSDNCFSDTHQVHVKHKYKNNVSLTNSKLALTEEL
ncbi:protocadherin Fat 4-like [Mantella aurantiaca]